VLILRWEQDIKKLKLKQKSCHPQALQMSELIMQMCFLITNLKVLIMKDSPPEACFLRSEMVFTENLANGEPFFTVDPALKFWNAMDDVRRVVIKSELDGRLRLSDDPLFTKLHD
jgi:hypothetical protein